MEQLILIAHLLIALAIIGLIMLQQGKGAEMGASFGGGGSQTLFGADGGGNVLTKATAILAVAFFATSFGLAIVAKQSAQPVDEFDLLVPTTQQAADQELPMIEDDIPAGMSAGDSDIPDVPVE
jgi:preprotein translocase subunit SecG